MTNLIYLGLSIALYCLAETPASYALIQASDELEALEHTIAQAWIEGDQATLDAVLEDDWSVIDVTGAVRTKADVFRDMFGPGAPSIADLKVDEVAVRLLDDVAVITGRTHWLGGDGTEVTLRFTDVAVRSEGTWRVVASHGTRVVE